MNATWNHSKYPIHVYYSNRIWYRRYAYYTFSLHLRKKSISKIYKGSTDCSGKKGTSGSYRAIRPSRNSYLQQNFVAPVLIFGLCANSRIWLVPSTTHELCTLNGAMIRFPLWKSSVFTWSSTVTLKLLLNEQCRLKFLGKIIITSSYRLLFRIKF